MTRVVWSRVRNVGLGIVAGTLAGTSSFVFLEGLDIVTKRRCHDGWLLWLLPLGGFLLGLVYHRFGGESGQGTALVVGRVHEAHRWVPTRMAPLVLLGTWTTHLFGGSAGREGTALQLAASLSHTFGRVGNLVDRDRAVLLVAAIGGGFGAVFGVPFAGTVFAMEVPSRQPWERILPFWQPLVSSPYSRPPRIHQLRAPSWP